MRTPVTPTTPTTPIPEAAAPQEPEKKEKRAEKRPKKKGGGILVGLFLVVFLGAGGAGGYWYFMMDAQWPLPFMQQASQPDSGTVTLDSLAGQDSLLIAAGDSSELGDSTAVDDTTAVEDTVVAPPLPETGVLTVRNLGAGARLSLNGTEVQGLTHELPPGSVHVRVMRAGYVDYETSVQVARGDTATVRVQWTRVEPVEPPAPVAQCGQPWSSETFNLGNACFDQGPTSQPPGPLHIVRNAAIQERVTTSYWVEIDATGAQRNWRSTSRERTPFDALAVRWIRRSLTFNPATKSGRPVNGWVLVTVLGRP
jgi:hypothetical protein